MDSTPPWPGPGALTPKALPNLPGQRPAPGLQGFPSLGKPPSRDDVPCPRAVAALPGRVLSQHASRKQTDDHTECLPVLCQALPGSRFPGRPSWEGHGVGCLVPFTSAGPGPACWTAAHQGPGPTGFLSVQSPCSGRPSGHPAHLGGPRAPAQPLVPSAPGDGTTVCLHVPSRSSTPRWAPEQALQGGGCKWHSTAFSKEAGLGLGAECWPSTQCV